MESMAGDMLAGGWRMLEGTGGADSYTFLELYEAMVFMVALWVAGKLVTLVGAPPLVGQILTGVFLGPHLGHFVPKVGAWKLIGEIGLMLLVVEAGIEVDLEMIRLIGLRGAVVAVAGSMVPLAIGFFIGQHFLGLDIKGSFVVGASVSPTSMGIALSVLRSGKLLNSPTGQLIIAAAVLDDIIALILLSELSALEDPTAWNVIKPIFSAIMLLFGFGFIAIYIIPVILNRYVYPHVPARHEDNVALGMLFLLTLGLAPAARASGGSYLLGCFIAGLSFCTSHQVERVWVSQVKRILTWLLRIFFGCTIAFEVPIESFTSLEVVKDAFIILVALVGKMATFIWARPLNRFNALVVASAMSALGEFAFIVVVYAKQEDFVTEDLAASIIMAILITIIIAPICLRLVIQYFARKSHRAVAKARDDTGEDAKGNPPLYYFMQTRCSGSIGLQDRLLRTLIDSGLKIVDIRSFHPRVNDLDVDIIFEAFLCDDGFRLPASRYRAPLPEEEEKIKLRLRALYEDLKKAIRDPQNGAVRVGRWYAGIRSEEDELDTEAAFGLAEKLMQERNQEFDVDVNRMEHDDDMYGLHGFVHRSMSDIDFLRNPRGSSVRTGMSASQRHRHDMVSSPGRASSKFKSIRHKGPNRYSSQYGSWAVSEGMGGSPRGSATSRRSSAAASIGLLQVYEDDDVDSEAEQMEDDDEETSSDGSGSSDIQVEILDSRRDD
ncbi:NapA type Na+/H+ antiporter [Hondaea fermentalgiana]|uniref:NapA type Na+/H+ antiporter n=1 Tax=Hondaea fermentalgiana TaxID=2315210 RepID=A0A2R5G8F4_9STRA|nr:NapA type Na+/H+ antiporter [Hondaea fermentalgiana]|eukprot:GBG23964.1 NapA type Na+/H+ antiporter [Hondaea fermentalgiana]